MIEDRKFRGRFVAGGRVDSIGNHESGLAVSRLVCEREKPGGDRRAAERTFGGSVWGHVGSVPPNDDSPNIYVFWKVFRSGKRVRTRSRWHARTPARTRSRAASPPARRPQPVWEIIGTLAEAAESRRDTVCRDEGESERKRYIYVYMCINEYVYACMYVYIWVCICIYICVK